MTERQQAFMDALQESPVIAALKNDEGLERALQSDCTTIFFLYGTILNIASLAQRAKDAGKLVFIHADLIEGMTAGYLRRLHRAEHGGGRHHFHPAQHHPSCQGPGAADRPALFPARFALV